MVHTEGLPSIPVAFVAYSTTTAIVHKIGLREAFLLQVGAFCATHFEYPPLDSGCGVCPPALMLAKPCGRGPASGVVIATW